MLTLALRNPRVQFVQGRVDSIEYTDSDPDSRPNPGTGGSETQRRKRRVKGVRYSRTTPGGGGGWTKAPPIPSFEEGVAKFSTESASAFDRGGETNKAGPTEEDTKEEEEEEESLFLPADQILLAAGPWSGALLDGLPIVGTRAHSIAVRPPLKDPPTGASGAEDSAKGMGEAERERVEISPYALFTSIEMPPPVRNNHPIRSLSILPSFLFSLTSLHIPEPAHLTYHSLMRGTGRSEITHQGKTQAVRIDSNSRDIRPSERRSIYMRWDGRGTTSSDAGGYERRTGGEG
jgi:hypothetical protein